MFTRFSSFIEVLFYFSLLQLLLILRRFTLRIHMLHYTVDIALVLLGTKLKTLSLYAKVVLRLVSDVIQSVSPGLLQRRMIVIAYIMRSRIVALRMSVCSRCSFPGDI